MLVESFFYALVLFFILGSMSLYHMDSSVENMYFNLVLSLGAGIYEEFVFRVILITGLSHVIGFIFQWNNLAKNTCAILLSAMFFSGFHFVGVYGEIPSINLFIISPICLSISTKLE